MVFKVDLQLYLLPDCPVYATTLEIPMSYCIAKVYTVLASVAAVRFGKF